MGFAPASPLSWSSGCLACTKKGNRTTGYKDLWGPIGECLGCSNTKAAKCMRGFYNRCYLRYCMPDRKRRVCGGVVRNARRDGQASWDRKH